MLSACSHSYQRRPSGVRRRSVLGLTAVASAVSQHCAHAQAPSGLQEITVTARRVEENLQDTPLAVSVFTGDRLTDRQVFETSELDQVVPNLQFADNAPLAGNNSSSPVFIRGIGQTVERVSPLTATDDPDLADFRDGGGKVALWHGWNDQLITAEGTVDYYDRVAEELGGYERTQDFARLFMAPGVAHCAGGDGPQPQGMFQAVVDWVEQGTTPERIIASKAIDGGGTRTRPLCPYPAGRTLDRNGQHRRRRELRLRGGLGVVAARF